MKRALFTIAWGILALVIALMAVSFLSGMLFFMLAASEIESENVRRLIMIAGMVLALVITGIVVLMGVQGILPGTKIEGTVISKKAADSNLDKE